MSLLHLRDAQQVPKTATLVFVAASDATAEARRGLNRSPRAPWTAALSSATVTKDLPNAIFSRCVTEISTKAPGRLAGALDCRATRGSSGEPLYYRSEGQVDELASTNQKIPTENSANNRKLETFLHDSDHDPRNRRRLGAWLGA
eukprot:scaffold8431_cov248-Pinguiococcus_pyrenoidosus.AAC.4